MLKIIKTSGVSAQEVMDYDKKLLERLEKECLLHFYEWRSASITYGYFVDPKKFLNLQNIEKFGIEIARRPTGGGVVFHIWDMAFSFLMSSSCNKFYFNTLQNYQFVNICVLEAIKEFLKIEREEIDLVSYDMPSNNYLKNFCMGRGTKYDVLIKNKKIAGAAQRRTKKGYLHQATIALLLPEKKILQSLLKEPEAANKIFSNTFALLKKDQKEAKIKLKELLIKHFKKNLLHKINS